MIFSLSHENFQQPEYIWKDFLQFLQEVVRKHEKSPTFEFSFTPLSEHFEIWVSKPDMDERVNELQNHPRLSKIFGPKFEIFLKKGYIRPN